MPDTAHKKLIFDSAPVIADVVLKHVSHDQDGVSRDFNIEYDYSHKIEDKVALFAYWSIILDLVTVLLVEGGWLTEGAKALLMGRQRKTTVTCYTLF